MYAEHAETTRSWGNALAHVETLGRGRSGEEGLWTSPAMILTDGDGAVRAGVKSHWPTAGTASHVPYLKRCEWHLRKNAKSALAKHHIRGGRHYLMRRLDTAFKREEGWVEFCEASAGYRHVDAWRARVQPQVDDQVARRHLLPAHHTLAALDQVFEHVQAMLERRAFCFRNAARMNLLLGLIRLTENKLDDTDHYHELLRDAAMAAGGRIRAQRCGYCADHGYDLRP